MNNSKFNQSYVQKTVCFILCAVVFLIIGFETSVMASPSGGPTYKVPVIKKKAVAALADTSKVYRVVGQMPKIIGGLQAVYKKISYPQEALSQGIEGRVIISFIVDKKGNVKNPKVLVGIGGGCGNAAIEALKDVKFKPGRKNGKPVNVKFSLPVRFDIK